MTVDQPIRVHIEGQEYEVTTKSIRKIMNEPEQIAQTDLDRLHKQVLTLNEGIAEADRVIKTAQIQKEMLKKNVKSALIAIEAIQALSPAKP